MSGKPAFREDLVEQGSVAEAPGAVRSARQLGGLPPVGPAFHQFGEPASAIVPLPPDQPAEPATIFAAMAPNTRNSVRSFSREAVASCWRNSQANYGWFAVDNPCGYLILFYTRYDR